MNGIAIIAKEKEVNAIRKDIQGRFAKITFAEPILEPIYYGRTHKTSINGKRLIRDANGASQFAIVSDKYRIMHHETIIQNLLDSLPEEYGTPDFNIKMINDGARMAITAKFPDINHEINGSKLEMMVRLQNSYDTSVLVGYQWGAMELVCDNGQVAFMEKGQSSAKHLSGSLDKLQLADAIEESMKGFSIQINLWQSWVNQRITDDIGKIYEALPYSESEIEKMIELPLMNHDKATLSSMKKPSLWAINSAATQYARHEVQSAKRALDLETGISTVMYDTSCKLIK